jgi:hypothetical protein
MFMFLNAFFMLMSFDVSFESIENANGVHGFISNEVLSIDPSHQGTAAEFGDEYVTRLCNLEFGPDDLFCRFGKVNALQYQSNSGLLQKYLTYLKDILIAGKIESRQGRNSQNFFRANSELNLSHPRIALGHLK